MFAVSIRMAPISALLNGVQQACDFHARDSPLQGLCAYRVCIMDDVGGLR
jgi:hypothetical protein